MPPLVQRPRTRTKGCHRLDQENVFGAAPQQRCLAFWCRLGNAGRLTSSLTPINLREGISLSDRRCIGRGKCAQPNTGHGRRKLTHASKRMSIRVFIGYRRDDSAGHAGRLHDRLESEFGRDLLFMDVDAIPLGSEFTRVLADALAKCDIFLAIIGPNWIHARDESGQRRLENPGDYVRMEIAAALRRKIPVIPVLLNNTPMPRAEHLPDDLKSLALRHGLAVRHESFHSDVDKLVSTIRRYSSIGDLVAQGRLEIDARITHGAPEGWFKPGEGRVEHFKDHDVAPEMVVIPKGSFAMGSSEAEIASIRLQHPGFQAEREAPRHSVTLLAPFAAGKFAVTFDEWDAFAVDGGRNGYRPSDEGWGRSKRPVINVTWTDAKAYVEWLSQKTGKSYRLLSEAEREYVTRAGVSSMRYWWGSTISPGQANYFDVSGNASKVDAAGRVQLDVPEMRTLPVESFEPNPWGLYQVHGNVWEWCEDVWHPTYNGAPSDGTAWTADGDTAIRVVRGGGWDSPDLFLRSAARSYHRENARLETVGFRVARSLE